jgi:hypothetical protein
MQFNCRKKLAENHKLYQKAPSLINSISSAHATITIGLQFGKTESILPRAKTAFK